MTTGHLYICLASSITHTVPVLATSFKTIFYGLFSKAELFQLQSCFCFSIKSLKWRPWAKPIVNYRIFVTYMADKAFITPNVLKWARESARMSEETAAAK